jgi:hypothetical protein
MSRESCAGSSHGPRPGKRPFSSQDTVSVLDELSDEEEVFSSEFEDSDENVEDSVESSSEDETRAPIQSLSGRADKISCLRHGTLTLQAPE